MSTKARIQPGDGDPRHGTPNGYSNLGCRCDACRTAMTAYARERGLGDFRRVPCPSCGEPKYLGSALCRACERAGREAQHGTATRARRCHCDACRAAAAEAKRAWRETKKVPCSHGCGTMVLGGPDQRDPSKPPECRPCARQRINRQRRAA